MEGKVKAAAKVEKVQLGGEEGERSGKREIFIQRRKQSEEEDKYTVNAKW